MLALRQAEERPPRHLNLMGKTGRDNKCEGTEEAAVGAEEEIGHFQSASGETKGIRNTCEQTLQLGIERLHILPRGWRLWGTKAEGVLSLGNERLPPTPAT